MKELILATSDEFVVRDIYPLLVSNKRLYLVSGHSRKFKNYTSKKIIELSKISAVKYRFGKSVLFKTLFILSLLLSIVSGGGLALIYFFQKNQFNTFKWPLLICSIVLFLTFILFLCLYLLKTTKILSIEYPCASGTKPLKITFKHVTNKDFNLLISSIFTAIDNLSRTQIPSSTKGTNLII